MSHTCIRLENLNQEFLSDLHIHSHTNRVNILWDQHSPTSTHITGLKQKMYVNLPSLPFSPMIPKYNGWASLVLLGKTQTNKPEKKTKNQAKPKNVIIYYQGGKKCPMQSLLRDNPSKVFKPSKTSRYYAHKSNSSAPEKGEGLMWQKRSNWNLSSWLGRDLHIVNVWDVGFFLN